MFWVNGELRDSDSFSIATSDRGLLLGDGLFETVKVADGRPVFLTEHLCRLQVAADEIALPIDRAALRQGVSALLGKAGPAASGALRISVARGPGPRGISPIPPVDQAPVSLITFAPSAPPSPQEGLDRLILAPFIRSSFAPSARMKTLSYFDNLSAKAYADDQKAADCIFENELGQVSSTTMANIFVADGEGFRTPPVSAGILPGIVREQIIHQATREGIPVKVCQLRPTDLFGRILYRTNSLIGVRAGWFDGGRDHFMPEQTPDDRLMKLYRHAEAAAAAS